ncbi:hypothetical protein EMIT0232MI5_210036 [Pseudomonas sp. IT-232MI5]
MATVNHICRINVKLYACINKSMENQTKMNT